MSAPRLTDTPAPDEPSAYSQDFYTWTLAQGAALRAGRWRDLDIANLAEEIEDLGSEKFNQLSSAFRVILTHMLTWDHLPARRSRSWVTSIRTQRIEVEDVLRDNPGLQSRVDEALGRAYRKARIEAAGETGLPDAAFPEACPYGLDEILHRPFDWPET